MFVYPDHNFLIGCIKNPEWRDLLTRSQQRGTMTLVLSPWHFYEFGNAREHEDTEVLVRLIEVIQPKWIMERADLQMFEYWVVWNQLWQSSKDEVSPIGPLQEIVALLTKGEAPSDHKFTLRDIVSHFSQDDALNLAKKELANQQKIAANYQQERIFGKFTDDADVRMDFAHLAVQQARIEIGRSEPDQVFAMANKLLLRQPIATQFDCFIYWQFMRKLKSYQVERAFTRNLCESGGKLGVTRFVDGQHAAMALPYVHIFVTEDRQLRNICTRIMETLPFSIAKVMTGEVFMETLRCL